ncbi:MAG: hypothetical protein ACRDVK_09520 [Acidimicrobiia bacterium]
MRRILIALCLFIPACATEAGETTTAAPTPTSAVQTTSAPDSQGVARAFVEAWMADDRATMESLSDPVVLEQADAIANLRGEDWTFDHCEGAAGTVFCIWAAGLDELVVGVRNVEEPHLVTSFALADV